MWIIVIFMACTGNVQQGWTQSSDCQNLPMGEQKDDCWGQFLIEEFQKDRKIGVEIIATQISDPKVQDFLWLEVTRKVDPSNMQYCKRIQDSTLQNRCQTLVNRPHLHRETLRQNAQQQKVDAPNMDGTPQRQPQ